MSIINEDNTEWFNAASLGNYKLVKKLIEEGIDVDCADKDGFTALILSSKFYHFSIVKKLIEHKCNINSTTNDGSTALMYASYEGHTSIVEYLIELNGINIDIKNNKGSTAYSYSRTDIIGLRIKKASEIKQVNHALLLNKH